MPTADYTLLFYVTAAVLFAALVALEIYRLRAGKRGRVVKLTCGAGLGLGDGRADVELADGRVVSARVPGCTQCMCRLRPGDAVVVTRARDEYLVGAALR